jgi:hypothetical protein
MLLPIGAMPIAELAPLLGLLVFGGVIATG